MTMMMKRSHWIAVAATAAMLYVVAYGVLRSRYAITHNSNADHWFAEKRSPGHFVNATCRNGVVSGTLEIVFWPLMRIEEFVHNRRHGSGVPTTGWWISSLRSESTA